MNKNITSFLICTLLITMLIPATAFDIDGVPHILLDNSKHYSPSTIDGDDWPMFRHDAQHTGYSTSLAPNTADINWSITVPGSIPIIDSSPSVVDGVLYIGTHTDCDEGQILLMNASNGNIINNINTGHVASSPAIYDQGIGIGKVLFVGSEVDDFKFYQCWVEQPEAAFVIFERQFSWSVFSSPVVDENRVYISHMSGFYCMDSSFSLQNIWYRDDIISNSYPTSSPALSNGKIYIGTADGPPGGHGWGDIYCLDAMDGSTLWMFETGDWVESSPAVVDGRVYAGSNDNNVYCLDANDGTEIWRFSTSGDIVSSPAVAYGNVYVGSCDHTFYCLDAETGVEKWSYQTENIILDSPAVADGKVYIGSHDLRLYCLNAMTGRAVWVYPTYDPIISSPAVDADGKLYVGLFSGGVIAFEYRPNTPPNIPSNPDPEDGANGVDNETDLDWSGGDPDSYQIITYDVYLGTTDPPTVKVADNQSATSFNPDLDYETTYYWKIVAWDGLGEKSEGPIWSFTTAGESTDPELELGEITGGTGVSVVIENVGDSDATDIEWSITIDGGLLLIPYGGYVEGTIDLLAAGDSADIGISFVFGLGLGIFTDLPTIAVSVDAADMDPLEKTAIVKIIGPFVQLQ